MFSYFRIDKEDDFAERKEFWRKLGNMGLLGITASSQYGGNIIRSSPKP
jgi:alkylation response protein AidB-like acyl-CoA dehydrogenase